MQINLTQKQTQAILCASENIIDDLNELKERDEMGVGWRIMFDDLIKGNKKSKKQYLNEYLDRLSVVPYKINQITKLKIINNQK